MDSEDWKEFKKKGKEIRLNRQDKHRRICYTFAYRNNLRHTAIQPWHIRLASEDVVLDIFPQGKKYNNLTEGRRGTYRNLEGFLKSVFCNEKKESGRPDSSRNDRAGNNKGEGLQ